MSQQASNLVQAGVHSIEGTTGGSRALALARQREADRAAIESKRAEIVSRNAGDLPSFIKASSATSAPKKTFQLKTVRLLFVSSLHLKCNALAMQAPITAAAKIAAASVGGVKRRPQAVLSFIQDDDDEDDDFSSFSKRQMPKKGGGGSRSMLFSGPAAPDPAGAAAAASAPTGISADQTSNHADTGSAVKRARLGKDPRAATDFLPDADRSAAEAATVLALKDEWRAAQEVMKEQPLRVTYSYYDGTGHRRTAVVKKGDSVAGFLHQVQLDMAPLFPELKRMGVDALLYVKEDLILPHNITFYELIVTKARGKSGPLFLFDVSEDIRLASDPRVEVKESHPGKVVQRKWYDANKHIFPASRWSVYDPTVTYDSYSLRK